MSNNDTDMTEFHWFMDILQTIDAGLVVLDRDYNIKLWNGFMESHSGMLPSQVRDKSLFELFPDISEGWFARKARPVFELRTRAFMTWEQRPFLFKFPRYRPITGSEHFMFSCLGSSHLSILRRL